jgi:hypothetical protein
MISAKLAVVSHEQCNKLYNDFYVPITTVLFLFSALFYTCVCLEPSKNTRKRGQSNFSGLIAWSAKRK